MIIEKDLKINDSVIRYRTAGDKKNKTLVFLHGWTGYEYLKSTLLEELAKDFYVIAPEHPGLLRSDPLKVYINIFDQYADVVFQVLVQEKLDKDTHIVIGQSFGGIVASAFAEKYKSNVSTLVLTDSQMGYQKHDLLRRILFKFGRQIIHTYLRCPNFIKKHGLKIFFGVISNSRSAKENNKLIWPRIEMISNCCALFRQAIKEKRNLLDRDYTDLPIVMLWGDTDGEKFNVSGYSKTEDAEKLYNKMKTEGRNVQFVTVEGGHTVLYKKPKETISEIKMALGNL